MSTASKFYPFDRTNVFYNLRDWQSGPREIVGSNPEWADSLAQAMYKTISKFYRREGSEARVEWPNGTRLTPGRA